MTVPSGFTPGPAGVVTLDCVQARTVIECYADGELDAVTTTRFEKHLEHCAGCRRALDRLSSLSSLIKEGAPYSAAPERLSRQIRARANDANVASGRAHGAWWHWLRPAALVVASSSDCAASRFSRGTFYPIIMIFRHTPEYILQPAATLFRAKVRDAPSR